jgi:hypothetical protein
MRVSAIQSVGYGGKKRIYAILYRNPAFIGGLPKVYPTIILSKTGVFFNLSVT